MKVLRQIVKFIGILFSIPLTYFLVSIILTYIPVNTNQNYSDKNKSVYISTNGVHLNIIIPKPYITKNLLSSLKYSDDDKYFAFGWGDKNFYLNTPTWSDLTFKNAFVALFLKSPSLIHFTRYKTARPVWVEINVNQNQLNKINNYILKTFYLNRENKKVILPDKGYYNNDDFYEALGSYSLFYTSNSWVNSILKDAGIKACLWTPFDFRLIDLHKKES